MKVGIIGAGFVGLSAAYKLVKEGVDVTVFEANNKPGGLASGFKENKWDWSLDRHYHHLFTNDVVIKDLAKEIGQELLVVRPKTSTFIDGEIFQLDSPASLLVFKKLPLSDRIRTGLVLSYLKYIASWEALESYTAKKFLKVTMGEKAWEVLWEPLFVGKFGKHADKIPASWFWSRIKKRTSSLCYPVGGFDSFINKLVQEVKANGGKIIVKKKVTSISKKKGKLIVQTRKRNYSVDKVISTLPSSVFTTITKNLPQNYIKKLNNLKGLGAVNLVLSLKHKLLENHVYWLNINDRNIPFLALVEHTNFINKSNYNNENLVYIGNYLDSSHKDFYLDAGQLLNKYLPHVKKINSNFNKSWIKKKYLFKDHFAQPIIPLNYSKIIPSLATPISGLYLANMQQVYPWDRGTNYAVELGYNVAELVMNTKN